MKYHKLIRYSALNVFFILVAGWFTACDEDIRVGSIEEKKYETSNALMGYITNTEGKLTTGVIEFRDAGKTRLSLHLSKNATQNVSASFKYDKAVLEAYNKANETSYDLFPEALVTFQNGGAVTIKTGESKSGNVDLSLVSGDTLASNKSYVIPIAVESKSGNVEFNDASNFLLFVKDLTKIPNAAKSTGIKIISCMEVNDTNPLNNLCFTLKNSGKPLVDIVILFSGNINYSSETGRVYNYNNPNVQHLLDNREKYLKPLQDRGIKIVLGILGNHDRAGVSNLADETAREFAKELKAVCDAYNLDGIFWDDEYTKTIYPAPIGFRDPSTEGASRLCYEAKKIMPDKLMCAYVYGNTRRYIPIDGVQPGDYVDWGIHDYYGYSDLSSNYPGLKKSGMALYSQEYARNYFAWDDDLEDLRSKGYGGHMIFAMDPFRSNFAQGQISSMKDIAKYLFDDELVYDGKPYKKDW